MAPRSAPLLDQMEGPVASFIGDGAYDRDDLYAEVVARHPAAAVVVPPRAGEPGLTICPRSGDHLTGTERFR